MMTQIINNTFNRVTMEAYETCRSMSSVDQHIREAMYDEGFELIDPDGPNVPSNYEPIEVERDGQPDAMQEWHDFDPDC